MESEEFLLLPVNQLIDIISSEELNVQNEEQVYVAAMAWVKHCLEDRKLHLSTVGKPIIKFLYNIILYSPPPPTPPSNNPCV